MCSPRLQTQGGHQPRTREETTRNQLRHRGTRYPPHNLYPHRRGMATPCPSPPPPNHRRLTTDYFTSIVHRPSSIVHRLSSIVYRLSSIVYRPSSIVLRPPLHPSAPLSYNLTVYTYTRGSQLNLMPIYEYDCAGCNRRVSIFFPTFSAVETRTAAGENRCPRCGSPDLTRRMSRVRALRHAGATSGSSDDDTGHMPGDLEGMAAGLDGLDETDPRAVARWARQMKETMGDDMDLGPDFDRALARIESGEDPERVMDDLDPEALGGPGGDEALDDADFDDI